MPSSLPAGADDHLVHVDIDGLGDRVALDVPDTGLTEGRLNITLRVSGMR